MVSVLHWAVLCHGVSSVLQAANAVSAYYIILFIRPCLVADLAENSAQLLAAIRHSLAGHVKCKVCVSSWHEDSKVEYEDCQLDFLLFGNVFGFFTKILACQIYSSNYTDLV